LEDAFNYQVSSNFFLNDKSNVTLYYIIRHHTNQDLNTGFYCSRKDFILREAINVFKNKKQ